MGGASVSFRPWDWTTMNSPQFDPTGRYIAYLKARPPGAPPGTTEHTVIHDISTGAERLWPEPHTHPHGWSLDGASILGWQHSGDIVICGVQDATCRPVAKGAAPVWPPGGQRIYFARPQSAAAPQELWSVALDGTGERSEGAIGTFNPLERFFTGIEGRTRRVGDIPIRTSRSVDGNSEIEVRRC